MSSRASNEKSLINTNITDDTENNDNENTKLNEEEVDKDEEEVDKDEEDVDNDEEEAEIDDEDVEIDDEDVEIDDEEEDEFDLDEDGEEVITKTVGKKSLKKTKITAAGGLVHLGHTVQDVDLSLAVGDDLRRFAFCPQLGSLHFGLGWGDHIGFEPALLQLDSYGFELLLSGDLGLLAGDHCFIF